MLICVQNLLPRSEKLHEDLIGDSVWGEGLKGAGSGELR